MHDVLSMTVVQRLQDLLKDSGGDILAEVLSLDDAIEKLTSLAQPIRELVRFENE